MFQEKRVLAVVPARGGSKGIPLKNIHPLGGKPLIAWTGEFLSELDWIDRKVVSTDSEQIKAAAIDCGIDAPFMRPDTLSGSRIGDWDVLHHALVECERLDGVSYDYVLMFQPTSPLRKKEDIEGAMRLAIEGGHDSVWSLSQTDTKNHPLKQLNVSGSDLSYYDEAGKKIIARQQLIPTYQRNGVVYVISRDCILERKTIWGAKPGAFVIEGKTVNIDEPLDVVWAEFLMHKAKLS